MNCQPDIIGKTGLQFFGKMSASISHEIKNVLAIINENAGLMEDITLLEAKGIPIDGDRVMALAGKIKAQIQRADAIVKNMNRFAHSVDEFVRETDVGELLELMAAMSGRFASMQGVTLELKRPSSPVMMICNPFLLENLIWLCLEFATDTAGRGKSVAFTADNEEKGVRIRFTGLDGLAEAPAGAFPAEREKALLVSLNAEMTANAGAGEILVTLFKDGSQ